MYVNNSNRQDEYDVIEMKIERKNSLQILNWYIESNNL